MVKYIQVEVVKLNERLNYMSDNNGFNYSLSWDENTFKEKWQRQNKKIAMFFREHKLRSSLKKLSEKEYNQLKKDYTSLKQITDEYFELSDAYRRGDFYVREIYDDDYRRLSSKNFILRSLNYVNLGSISTIDELQARIDGLKNPIEEFLKLSKENEQIISKKGDVISKCQENADLIAIADILRSNDPLISVLNKIENVVRPLDKQKYASIMSLVNDLKQINTNKEDNYNLLINSLSLIVNDNQIDFVIRSRFNSLVNELSQININRTVLINVSEFLQFLSKKKLDESFSKLLRSGGVKFVNSNQIALDANLWQLLNSHIQATSPTKENAELFTKYKTNKARIKKLSEELPYTDARRLQDDLSLYNSTVINPQAVRQEMQNRMDFLSGQYSTLVFKIHNFEEHFLQLLMYDTRSKILNINKSVVASEFALINTPITADEFIDSFQRIILDAIENYCIMKKLAYLGSSKNKTLISNGTISNKKVEEENKFNEFINQFTMFMDSLKNKASFFDKDSRQFLRENVEQERDIIAKIRDIERSESYKDGIKAEIHNLIIKARLFYWKGQKRKLKMERNSFAGKFVINAFKRAKVSNTNLDSEIFNLLQVGSDDLAYLANAGVKSR